MESGSKASSISEMIRRFRTEAPTSREQRESLREKGKISELWFAKDSTQKTGEEQNIKESLFRNQIEEQISKQVENQIKKYSKHPSKGLPNSSRSVRNEEKNESSKFKVQQRDYQFEEDSSPFHKPHRSGTKKNNQELSTIDRMILEDVQAHLDLSDQSLELGSPVLRSTSAHSPERDRRKTHFPQRRAKSTLTTRKPISDTVERLSGPIPPPPIGSPLNSPPRFRKFNMQPTSANLVAVSSGSSILDYGDIIEMKATEKNRKFPVKRSPNYDFEPKTKSMPADEEFITYDALDKDSLDVDDDLLSGIRRANALLKKLRPEMHTSLLPKQVHLDPKVTFRWEPPPPVDDPPPPAEEVPAEEVPTDEAPVEEVVENDVYFTEQTNDIAEQMSSTVAHLLKSFGANGPMSPVDRYRFQESLSWDGDLPFTVAQIAQKLDAAILPMLALSDQKEDALLKEQEEREKEKADAEERFQKELAEAEQRIRQEFQQERVLHELETLQITPKFGGDDPIGFLGHPERDKLAALELYGMSEDFFNRSKLIKEIETGVLEEESLEIQEQIGFGATDQENKSEDQYGSDEKDEPDFELKRMSLQKFDEHEANLKTLEDLPNKLDSILLALQDKLGIEEETIEEPEKSEEPAPETPAPPPEPPELTMEERVEELFSYNLEDPVVKIAESCCSCGAGIMFPAKIVVSQAELQSCDRSNAEAPAIDENHLIFRWGDSGVRESFCGNCIVLNSAIPAPSAPPAEVPETVQENPFNYFSGLHQPEPSLPHIPANTQDFTGASLRSARSRLQQLQGYKQQRKQFEAVSRGQSRASETVHAAFNESKHQKGSVHELSKEPNPGYSPHYTPEQLKQLRKKYLESLKHS